MSDLLDKIYLPELKKKNLINSNAYRFLKENKQDPSILEGYEHEPDIKSFISNAKNKTDEEWSKELIDPKMQGEAFADIGSTIYEILKDTGVSIGIAAVNGTDVATNLMPLIFKVMSKSPIAAGVPKEFFNPKTEQEVYNAAKYISNNLDKAREYLYTFQDDHGVIEELVGLITQDLAFSMPAYNYLKKAGVPKYPAFFISGAIGALGIEDEKDGIKTRFTGETVFAKDIIKLKELLAILPDTPEDQIANEVIQALEYGSFSAVLPGIIDAFKFMKRYIPAMTTTGAASAVMFSDNEAHGSIKNIVNAVNKVPMFRSTVVDAAGKLQSSGTGEQILKTLSNQPGVKLNEIKWMNLDTYLNNRAKDIVTKDEVIDFINANKIDVSEVKLSDKGAPARMSEEIENMVNEFEMKVSQNYPKSAFARRGETLESALNYDKYIIRSYKYDKAIENNLSHDWQSFNKNPLVQAMEEEARFTGLNKKFKDIENSLLNWKVAETGKYTGHLIEVAKKDMKKWTNDLRFETAVTDGGEFGVIAERFVVSENQLAKLKNKKFKKVETFEIEPIDLEKFLIEENVRSFKLSFRDNLPVYGSSNYTVPGGEDYTELVFKVKNKDNTMPAVLEGEFGTLKGNKVKATQKTSIDYRSPHFHKMNEFAHVRFKTRYLDNGKKVLAVEEMQSDLLQASKTQLFESSSSIANQIKNFGHNEKVLKDFPFKNTWYEFTIKRLTRYAADNGFDAIAIPKGSLAANRYGQSTFKAKKVKITPDIDAKTGEPNSDEFILEWLDGNGKTVKKVGINADTDYFYENIKRYEKEISGNFAEFQNTLLEATETYTAKEFNFPDEKVLGSGAGKFRLYDQTIPAYMKKYAKKWNAKVYDDNIEIVPKADRPNPNYSSVKNFDLPVTVLEFSKEMRKEITTNSQPLFSFLGGVTLSTWGAKEIKDNMENNIISQSTY